MLVTLDNLVFAELGFFTVAFDIVSVVWYNEVG